ncbi:hypothetical protein ACMFMG_010434 [Clarireedia jacksonii]
MVEHLNEPEDNDHRYARFILQSSSKPVCSGSCRKRSLTREGLLDIDILYEPTQLSQRCLNMQPNHPNVEHVVTNDTDVTATTESRLYEISCSACCRLIQSNIFYECTRGCKSDILYEYTESRWQKHGSDAVSEGSESCSSIQRRYCLCAPCNTTEGCCLGHHLSLVRYKDPDIAGIRELRAQLNQFRNENKPEPSDEDEREEESETEDESQTRNEDHTKGNYNKGGKTETKDGDEKQYSNHPAATKHPWQERLAIKVLTATEAEGSKAQLALRTCALMLKGNLAPAGNFHLSFMFGPLIFESGLRKINHGILVSPRLPPSLFSQNFNNSEEVQCPFLYRHKDSQQLEYQHKQIMVKQRPLLACIKRVYGGSFW